VPLTITTGRADDEHVSATRFRDENGSGRTLVEATLHRYAIWIDGDVPQGFFESSRRTLAKTRATPGPALDGPHWSVLALVAPTLSQVSPSP
jgi:hypothetical protein